MSKRKQIKGLYNRVVTLDEKVRNLEHDIQFKETTIQHLADRIKDLDATLVEAGILEHEWKPEAPKGSSIKSNFKYYEPTYTKINKVWE